MDKITFYNHPRPYANRILVEIEIDPEYKIESDLIAIPEEIEEDNRKRGLESTQTGVVVDLGPAAIETAVLKNEGTELRPGNVILFLQNCGISYQHEDKNKIYRLLKPADIMAVLGEMRDE